jgi:integrase
MTSSKDFFIKVSVDYYLDKRRLLNNGKYPLKIRIYDSIKQQNHFLRTRFELTEEENKNYPKSNKKTLLVLKNDLDEYLHYIRNLVKTIEPFEIDSLKQKYLNKRITFNTVEAFFDEKMQDLKNSGKISTYNSYKDAMSSFEKYTNYNNKDFRTLTFDEINIKWIKGYEDFTTKIRNCSINTTGIYLRNLRAIYNEAINRNVVEKVNYPFGKNQFSIKRQKMKKEVLSETDIKILEGLNPKNKNQQIAKDYWLFSYYTCGINLTDLAYLKSKNITKDKIRFIRRKTENNRINNTEIVLPLHPKNIAILERLIDKEKEYVFGIIDKTDSPEMKNKKIKQFLSVLNNNFKILTKEKINTEKITFYNARHTWATHLSQNGAPITHIKEQLGHTNITTTSNYIASLPLKLENDFIQKTFYGK